MFKHKGLKQIIRRGWGDIRTSGAFRHMCTQRAPKAPYLEGPHCPKLKEIKIYKHYYYKITLCEYCL